VDLPVLQALSDHGLEVSDKLRSVSRLDMKTDKLDLPLCLSFGT
jgi:hypothetical protein